MNELLYNLMMWKYGTINPCSICNKSIVYLVYLDDGSQILDPNYTWKEGDICHECDEARW